MIRTADAVLKSLTDLDQYLQQMQFALRPDTVDLYNGLEDFVNAKGPELHSVVDHLKLTGYTAQDLKMLADIASKNGKTLDAQLRTLQTALLNKGATLQARTVQ